MELGGHKIALGVPGGKPSPSSSSGSTPSTEDYPSIPLRRGGTAEEAAAAVLL